MAPPCDRVARVPALIVHGGAGADPAEEPDELRAGVTAAALAGWRVLAADGRALEAVEAAVRALEDHPRFNAATARCSRPPARWRWTPRSWKAIVCAAAPLTSKLPRRAMIIIRSGDKSAMDLQNQILVDWPIRGSFAIQR
jgi:hypothetical protein